MPVTVRSPDTAGRVVVLNATTTWQASNMWGGHDLYEGSSGYDTRSYAVSFDRPYDRTGAGKFLTYEQPAIALAEKAGRCRWRTPPTTTCTAIPPCSARRAACSRWASAPRRT
ncbi:hypothetical protein BKA00_005133 [Actinomadura coerulea]|uniref:N,N-dimethylformamidase beta subunit-like C-terminal domain-containing protein n=1 Tax=Actinomadura coerulea TaxID=46159 RepID=A0A7X0G2Z1_9ACTN|nr:hypothetical protein [Actinomadura coerulea]GGQ11267.1 hypothetical protein GCM10010187_29500 [Actinomadura coerulea]